MTTTLEDIRFIVERNIQDTLENDFVINACNVAHSEFMLRLKLPGNTTLFVDTTSLEYTLPSGILEFRRFRYQSDLDNGYNRSVNFVYSYYDGVFEVPTAFTHDETILIDYYGYPTTFTLITEEIDIADRFKPMYTTYIEAIYHSLPSTIQKIGEKLAMKKYEQAYSYYLMIKKQVMDYYIISIGIQKPAESGW